MLAGAARLGALRGLLAVAEAPGVGLGSLAAVLGGPAGLGASGTVGAFRCRAGGVRTPLVTLLAAGVPAGAGTAVLAPGTAPALLAPGASLLGSGGTRTPLAAARTAIGTLVDLPGLGAPPLARPLCVLGTAAVGTRGGVAPVRTRPSGSRDVLLGLAPRPVLDAAGRRALTGLTRPLLVAGPLAPWPLAAGTPIYAQVDSVWFGSSYGVIAEVDELCRPPYNNIAGPVTVVEGALGVSTAADSADEPKDLRSTGLPRRR